MVVTFNYQDGDKCVTFNEVNGMPKQKENADNHKDCQRSPLSLTGDPYEVRTRDAAVKGRSLNHLTNGPCWIVSRSMRASLPVENAFSAYAKHPGLCPFLVWQTLRSLFLPARRWSSSWLVTLHARPLRSGFAKSAWRFRQILRCGLKICSEGQFFKHGRWSSSLVCDSFLCLFVK